MRLHDVSIGYQFTLAFTDCRACDHSILNLVYFDPVRIRRVTSFLDVEANAGDSAYQLWQGMLAFGVGALMELGWVWGEADALSSGGSYRFYFPGNWGGTGIDFNSFYFDLFYLVVSIRLLEVASFHKIIRIPIGFGWSSLY